MTRVDTRVVYQVLRCAALCICLTDECVMLQTGATDVSSRVTGGHAAVVGRHGRQGTGNCPDVVLLNRTSRRLI